jgi:hypothetical protein
LQPYRGQCRAVPIQKSLALTHQSRPLPWRAVYLVRKTKLSEKTTSPIGRRQGCCRGCNTVHDANSWINTKAH